MKLCRSQRLLLYLVILGLLLIALWSFLGPWGLIVQVIIILLSILSERIRTFIFGKTEITIDIKTLGKAYARETQKLKDKKEYQKRLNNRVFNPWMKISIDITPFHIEIPIDENIDKVLLKDAIDFLESKSKKYGKILELKKKIKDLRKNYNDIGGNIITNINNQLSIAYPSLNGIESRKVSNEDCYVIDNIKFLIWYRLKRSFSKNGFVDWGNIRFEEIYNDNIWRLTSNLAWKVFIQSKNKSDVDEEYFKDTMAELLKTISNDLRQQDTLIKKINQKVTEFKNEVHNLSNDIESNRA